jgi:hypothetical protein
MCSETSNGACPGFKERNLAGILAWADRIDPKMPKF